MEGMNMFWKQFLCIYLVLMGLVTLGGVQAGWSQQGTGALPSKGNDPSLFGKSEGRPEKSLAFPTTTEGIVQELGIKPSGPAFQKGARGLGGIADDEQAIAAAPKVGALVLFDFDSDGIKAESLPLLQEFGKAFQSDKLKDAVLIVAGHTDNTGSDEYNLNLSRRRAEAIKTFLVSQYRLPENQLLVKFYGENKPLESNETTEGRAKNRRVEFIRIQ
jgi:outer membrane protein OmpA-like peptidoglycan-associated protein